MGADREISAPVSPVTPREPAKSVDPQESRDPAENVAALRSVARRLRDGWFFERSRGWVTEEDGPQWLWLRATAFSSTFEAATADEVAAYLSLGRD